MKLMAKDTAVLRTLINAKAQNFATKRLLKDLEAIEKETIPTVGVTARPLEHDLFIWHANIRGPEGSAYDGGVFHLELQIPQSYPHQPPIVTLFTPLPHPNVFGQSICLDMLKVAKKEDKNTVGWTSAYSIQSVLLQLQAFLFEEHISENKEKGLAQIKKAVLAANQYKCTAKNCKHGGKLSLWPSFNKKETDLENFISRASPQELIEQQFVCFHTKLPYKMPTVQNIESDTKLKRESCLGIMLNVTKVPRTGQIKQAVPSLDYVSVKAFLNEGIKWDSMNATYTHWLPLYFGKNDNKERVLHLVKRSLSMIMTNNTRRFKPEYILEVFPKITQSIVFQMMDQKTHPSIRSMRMLAQVHALWLLCMEEFPQLYDQIEQNLERFIAQEKFRHKEHTPNLGILFNLLYVAPKMNFNHLVEAYTAEQLDRQVFWLIKEIPELGDDKVEESISAAKRVEISFKQQSTSFQMGCFQYLYLSVAKQPFKTPKELLDRYENNFCLLSTGQENAIQERAFDILKTVVNYDSFYKFVGQPTKTVEDINTLLKQSVKNSRAKKYHGTIQEMNELPKPEVQVQVYKQKFVQIESLYDVKVEAKQKDHIYTIKQKTQLGEADWRKLLAERWEWVADELQWNPEITATQIAEIAYTRDHAKPLDRLYTRIVQLKSQYDTKIVPTGITTQTWQQVFMKFDFEDFLKYFDECADFKQFYAKLHIVKDHLTHLVFPLIQVRRVQSGYHFVTAAIEVMQHLKQLTFSGSKNSSDNIFPKKAAKAIYKGLNNLSKGQHCLETVIYEKIFFKGSQNEITECIFSPLFKFQDNLKSLHIIDNELLGISNAAKSTGLLITNMKQLEEIVMQNSLKANQAKEITDGLMRAKQLAKVDISRNTQITEKALSSIIYNLSFSPRLVYLDISHCGSVSGTDLGESLYKLLRITASLEVLNCKYNTGLCMKLTKEFFQALGESRTLKVLNLDFCGQFDDTKLDELGKAVAFNANKGGQLSILNLKGVIANYARLRKLLESMSVTKYEHEQWYGDALKASKMEGDDYKKVFSCNLQNLDVSETALGSGFDINQYKQQYKGKINDISNVFLKNTKMVSLNFQSKSLVKKDADLLQCVMIPKHLDGKLNLRVLNLAKNKLDKEGAKIIANIIEQNNTVEVLDISQNDIGVSGGKTLALALIKNTSVKILNLFDNMIGFDGARGFGETLKVNNTLELIDFGMNRIRNKGLNALALGLSANKTTKVKCLGLRFNFLNEEGIISFLKVTKVPELFIKNNSISEYGLFQLKKYYDEAKLQVKLDLFQKLSYTEESRLERTVWIQPQFSVEQLIKFCQVHDVGVIVNARCRKGVKHPNRVVAPNAFNFIEFADAMSLPRAMALASTSKAIIDGKAFRIFKAGTGTFQYQKKSAKQKKAETSKTNVLPSARIVAGGRGRGVARGAARGAAKGGRPARGRR